MFLFVFLYETASANLLVGFMPEPVGLLVFGVALFGSAAGLRRIYTRKEARKSEGNFAAKINKR